MWLNSLPVMLQTRWNKDVLVLDVWMRILRDKDTFSYENGEVAFTSQLFAEPTGAWNKHRITFNVQINCPHPRWCITKLIP